MSEHFKMEGDLSLRCFVIQHKDTKQEFGIPYTLWDEFVTFIKDIGTNRAKEGRANMFPKIEFSQEVIQ